LHELQALCEGSFSSFHGLQTTSEGAFLLFARAANSQRGGFFGVGLEDEGSILTLWEVSSL